MPQKRTVRSGATTSAIVRPAAAANSAEVGRAATIRRAAVAGVRPLRPGRAPGRGPGRAAHRQVQHQAVVGELEELGQHVERYVVAQHSGVALAAQPVPGGVGDRRGALAPSGWRTPDRCAAGGRPRTGCRASRPCRRAGAGLGEQVAHHLDEAVAGDRGDHRGGVVLGDGQEQGVLVAEVVEDRAAGQAGLLLQPAHGGALVAVPREAARAPPRGSPGGARRAGPGSPGARCRSWQVAVGDAIRTYGLPEPGRHPL